MRLPEICIQRPVFAAVMSLMIVLIMFYSIVVPLNVAFETGYEDSVAYAVVDVLFSCCFLVDLGLNCITTFRATSGPRRGEMEERRSGACGPTGE